MDFPDDDCDDDDGDLGKEDDDDGDLGNEDDDDDCEYDHLGNEDGGDEENWRES